MKIPEKTLEEIRDKLDIVDIVSRYIDLKPSGRNYKALCPFHDEKTPSFVVSPEKQIFHCFGCGASGNVINFVQKIENISFIEAVRMLAKEAGVPLEDEEDRGTERKKALIYAALEFANIFYRKHLKRETGKDALSYLLKRGITPPIIEAFSIGWAPFAEYALGAEAERRGYTREILEESGLIYKTKEGRYIDYFRGRIILPIRDLKGRVVGFGGRVLGSGEPKYINTRETPVFKKSDILYGIDIAKDYIKKRKEVFIVEGYMDLIALYKHNIENAVATLGTSLTVNQARILKRFSRNVFIAYDGDKAGNKATLRGIQIFKKQGIDVGIIEIPEGEDPDTFLKKYGRSAFLRLREKSRGVLDFLIDVRKREYNTDDPEERAKFIRELVRDISELAENLELATYIKAIGERFDIEEKLLYNELSKLKRRKRGKDEERGIEGRGIEKTQEAIIGIILSDQEAKDIALSRLSEEDFPDKVYRDIFTKIRELAIIGKEAEDIFFSLTDEEREIVGKALKEASIFTEPAHALFGFIDALKEFKEKQEYFALLERIKRGEVNPAILQDFLEKCKIKS